MIENTPTLVAVSDTTIHIHVPGETVRVEHVPHAGQVCIRQTRFGPMRFELAGVRFGVPQYRVPAPAAVEDDIESIWDGVESLLGERPEKSSLLYSLGDDAPSQVQDVPNQRLELGAA